MENKDRVLDVIRRMLSAMGYDVYNVSDAQLVADLDKLVQALKKEIGVERIGREL